MTATATVDRASAALLVERLTKVYGDGTRALDELELRIPSGCFLGLLGPNGAGKTTLIGAISGLVRAPAGRVFVFGHDAVTDLQSRLLVGVAPQEVHLDRFLTARELAPRPRLLILDEPTAGVDLELRHELWRYLRRLHGEQGLTVLLTTHYLEEAEALCERIAFIRAGKISAEGTSAELTQRFGGERLEQAYLEAMRT